MLHWIGINAHARLEPIASVWSPAAHFRSVPNNRQTCPVRPISAKPDTCTVANDCLVDHLVLRVLAASVPMFKIDHNSNLVAAHSRLSIQIPELDRKRPP